MTSRTTTGQLYDSSFQVSNLWKIFVNNKEDKDLYSEYTDIQNKDIVKVINKNLNAGIVKFLKKCLKKV